MSLLDNIGVLGLGGPYRWYIIGVLALLLTALFSRLVFKTIKWVLVLLVLTAIGLLVAGYLRGR